MCDGDGVVLNFPEQSDETTKPKGMIETILETVTDVTSRLDIIDGRISGLTSGVYELAQEVRAFTKLVDARLRVQADELDAHRKMLANIDFNLRATNGALQGLQQAREALQSVPSFPPPPPENEEE